MGQLEDIADAIDQETNAIAARLDKDAADLAAAKAAGQPPDPATIARLQASSARLKTLGQDPAAIVPPAPPPATTTPGT